jgi:hypothetical protein
MSTFRNPGVFRRTMGYRRAGVRDAELVIDSPKSLDQPCSIHRPNLIEHDLLALALEAARYPRRVGRSFGLNGATITVRMLWLISSGDTTTQGRVFLISLPIVGSRLTK